MYITKTVLDRFHDSSKVNALCSMLYALCSISMDEGSFATRRLVANRLLLVFNKYQQGQIANHYLLWFSINEDLN
jgi:hypothetical protein